MSIELRPHKATNVITKKTVCFEQYLIFEGHPDAMERVGLVGWKPGSNVVFLVPVDPVRAKRITDYVSEQLEAEVKAINCPDIPMDILNPPNREYHNEFNESDFT